MNRLAVVLLLSIAAFAQNPAPAKGPTGPIADANKLVNEGKHDEALAAYQKIAAADPKNWDAHRGIGVVLDLQGKYAEARKHLQQAIDLAPADSKPNAWRTMAMSYAFDRNTKEIERYQKQVFDYRLGKNDYQGAAEVANEAARMLLESGDIDAAATWYRVGYTTALKKTDLAEKDRDLWEFRWHSAQARIAARRGNRAGAQKHADAGKALIDKGTNPEQAPYVPYVYGYNAFYAGDYKTAIDEFSKSNPNDPFNLVMIAQAYEKQGDKAKAKEYYEKVLATNAHNPTGAYARPIAQQKLKAKS
jgi:tetratricopeptide (TPR) repeat protein